MIKDFKKATEQLKELAEVLNSFKSETVQLKLVEFFLGQDFSSEPSQIEETKQIVETVREPITVKKPKKEQPVDVAAPEVVKVKTKGRPPKEREKTEKVKVAKKRIPNRPGPSIILNALLNDDFFTENRTIGQIVEQCDEKYHYNYKSTDLSGTLAKLAKEGILARGKNPLTNQFEYIKG